MENRSSGVLKVSVSVLRNSGDVVSAELGIMGPLAGDGQVSSDHWWPPWHGADEGWPPGAG